MKQLSKLEIIEKTVAYYSEDTSRRAINEMDQCEYLMPDGRMCGVGRCLQNPGALAGNDLYDAAISGVFELAEFMPQYGGHNVTFWSDIQDMHDCIDNWDDNGITREGILYKKELIEKWT